MKAKFVHRAAAVTAAHSRGQTLLPLPPGPAEGAPSLGQRALTPKEQEQLQLLEAAALTWTRQIKQALRTAAFESLNASACCSVFMLLPTATDEGLVMVSIQTSAALSRGLRIPQCKCLLLCLQASSTCN